MVVRGAYNLFGFTISMADLRFQVSLINNMGFVGLFSLSKILHKVMKNFTTVVRVEELSCYFVSVSVKFRKWSYSRINCLKIPELF